MLSNFRISTKIYGFVAIIFCFIAVLGTVSFVQMQKIGVELVNIAEEDIPITNAFTQITVNQLQQAVLFERGMAALFKFKLELGTAQTVTTLIDDFKALSIKNEALIIQVEERIQQAMTLSHSTEARDQLTELLTILKKVAIEHTEYDRAVITTLSSANTIDIDTLFKNESLIEALEDKIDHALIMALNHIQSFTLEAVQTAEHDEIIGQQLILSISIFTAVVAILLAFVIVKAITLPVNKMRDSLQVLAGKDADLNMRLVVTKDETGEAAEAFNSLMNKLHAMIVHISNTSNYLDKQSNDAIIMMEKTLLNIEQQQLQTDTVAVAVSQMAGSIREVTDSTIIAEQLGKQLKEEISSSLNSADKNQQVIKILGDNVDLAANEIESLASETNRIGEVLNGIKGIAEQTNLLALNAAIEAARAGDSGRGFAVVADEVRALAQRTQSSTQDIQNLLGTLQQEVSNAVKSMQQGKTYAVTCMEKALSTAQSLKVATGAVLEMSALNSQIAAASEQQAVAALEINNSLQDMTKNCAQTTQKTQNTALSSKNISHGLRDLNIYASQLKT